MGLGGVWRVGKRYHDLVHGQIFILLRIWRCIQYYDITRHHRAGRIEVQNHEIKCDYLEIPRHYVFDKCKIAPDLSQTSGACKDATKPRMSPRERHGNCQSWLSPHQESKRGLLFFTKPGTVSPLCVLMTCSLQERCETSDKTEEGASAGKNAASTGVDRGNGAVVALGRHDLAVRAGARVSRRGRRGLAVGAGADGGDRGGRSRRGGRGLVAVRAGADRGNGCGRSRGSGRTGGRSGLGAVLADASLVVDDLLLALDTVALLNLADLAVADDLLVVAGGVVAVLALADDEAVVVGSLALLNVAVALDADDAELGAVVARLFVHALVAVADNLLVDSGGGLRASGGSRGHSGGVACTTGRAGGDEVGGGGGDGAGGLVGEDGAVALSGNEVGSSQSEDGVHAHLEGSFGVFGQKSE